MLCVRSIHVGSDISVGMHNAVSGLLYVWSFYSRAVIFADRITPPPAKLYASCHLGKALFAGQLFLTDEGLGRYSLLLWTCNNQPHSV